MAPRDKDRQYASGMGEFYLDALAVEAALKQRSIAAEAGSLLCAKLQEREARRTAMVLYMANRRNISFNQMWSLLLGGEIPTAEDLSEATPELEH
jgi:plasmid stability protein